MKREVNIDQAKVMRRQAWEAKTAAMREGRRERAETFTPKTAYSRKSKYPTNYTEET
jgi:hypothetical protein